jgi:hypothetical protein
VNDLDLVLLEKDKLIEAAERDIKDLMDSTKVIVELQIEEYK